MYEISASIMARARFTTVSNESRSWRLERKGKSPASEADTNNWFDRVYPA